MAGRRPRKVLTPEENRRRVAESRARKAHLLNELRRLYDKLPHTLKTGYVYAEGTDPQFLEQLVKLLEGLAVSAGSSKAGRSVNRGPREDVP